MEKKGKHQVYAIVRLDRPDHDEPLPPEILTTVTKVVWTLAEARSEVERLREINPPPQCIYFWCATRLVGPTPEPSG